MSFKTDKQTLDDLNILGKNRTNSIFGLYNATHTKGGAKLLEAMFAEPLSDEGKIRGRLAMIGYFHRSGEQFPFRGKAFETADFYLNEMDPRNRISVGDDRMLQMKLRRLVKANTGLEPIHDGVVALIEIINVLHEFIARIDKDQDIGGNLSDFAEVKAILSDSSLAWAKQEKGVRKLQVEKAATYDNILRNSHRGAMLKLLSFTYLMDVFMSVAQVARKQGYAFPTVLPPASNRVLIRGGYHPQLENPTANDIEITGDNNVIFLTGANMAGKSTFMKTFGVIMYLAHMGFPVPAAEMEFSVRNGLYTSINLADNLNWGYSHFYSEVVRLKKVAYSVNQDSNMIIIFDELFRGTNVKDAYDATVAVTSAFAEIRDSIFIISTHIIESGEALAKECDNIEFLYLPTLMEGTWPVYPYKLTRGITADRHGMLIIRNEGIIDMIKNPKKI